MTLSAPEQSSPLRLLDPPSRLHVPLATRPLTEAAPEIIVNRIVAKGEALSDGPVEGGPAALAPTSGRIVAQSLVTLTNGHAVPAVEFEPDFQDRPALEPPHDPARADQHRELIDSLEKVSPDQLGPWIDRLRNAGVWADRMSSPDLLAQLHQILRRPIDTIICNLVDHDPMLRTQAQVAARFSSVLVSGVSLLARLTSARNVWIAVEAGTAALGGIKWWVPLRRELRKASIDIVPVLADYPQADPTLLIYTLLRRRLRPGRMPVEQGVLMLDGISAIAVGRAALREQPMLQTPLAVRDHVRGRSHLLVVPIGATVRHVLEYLKLHQDALTLLRGDVLRNQEITPDAVVAGGELNLQLLPAHKPDIPDPCIRCGWCAQACPTIVQPAGLLEAAQRNDLDLADHFGLDSCIECGICSYMCPSHLPLLDGIRLLKKQRKQ